MATGPITSWEIDGETVETVADFIFLGSKITAEGDCSHEIKRCLLLGIYFSSSLYNHKGFDLSIYLNSLVVFPTFFNLSLNLAIRSS